MAYISESQATGILRDARDKSYDTAAKGEVASLSTELGAKAASVKASEKQAHGEMADSITKFASSGIGTMLNAKLAVHGNTTPDIRKMKDEADAAFAARQQRELGNREGIKAAAQNGQVAQVIDKATDVMSQSVGGQAEVNQAKIAAKFAELTETSAKMVNENFKASKDEAAKAQDGVNDFAKGIYDRAAQVINKAFG